MWSRATRKLVQFMVIQTLQMYFYHLFKVRDDTAVEGCAGFHAGLYYPYLKKKFYYLPLGLNAKDHKLI